MKLMPMDVERLLLFLAAELARKSRTAGLKGKRPETVGLIRDKVVDAGRAGESHDEAPAVGYARLREENTLEGVADMVGRVVAESPFGDRTQAHHSVPPVTNGESDQRLVPPGGRSCWRASTNELRWRARTGTTRGHASPMGSRQGRRSHVDRAVGRRSPRNPSCRHTDRRGGHLMTELGLMADVDLGVVYCGFSRGRADRSAIFTALRHGHRVDEVVDRILAAGRFDRHVDPVGGRR